MLTWFLHSRLARVISSPLFTLPLFIASLYGLYFTPLFDFVMGSWLGHEWMLAHFLMTGLLFFWPILGIDPAPRRPPHVLRMLELFVGMPFHAFFGIAVMMSRHPRRRLLRPPTGMWHLDPLADQNTGGGIAWAFSEIPTALVVIIFAAGWARASEREGRRLDREADRDGDQQLQAYNAYLARLAARR